MPGTALEYAGLGMRTFDPMSDPSKTGNLVFSCAPMREAAKRAAEESKVKKPELFFERVQPAAERIAEKLERILKEDSGSKVSSIDKHETEHKIVETLLSYLPEALKNKKLDDSYTDDLARRLKEEIFPLDDITVELIAKKLREIRAISELNGIVSTLEIDSSVKSTVKRMIRGLNGVDLSDERGFLDLSAILPGSGGKRPGKWLKVESCRNISQEASEGKVGRAWGRTDEIRKIVTILSREGKNNVALLGDAGVGKTQIAEELAHMTLDSGFQILELNITDFTAGTSLVGAFEEKVKKVLDAIGREKVIIFIDEMHSLTKSQGISGNLGNILKPALARGNITVIGATTVKEYRQNIEKDTALNRRFEPVMVEELAPDATLTVLEELRRGWQARHKLKISDDVIGAVIRYSERFVSGRFHPDKDIDIINTTLARVEGRQRDIALQLDALWQEIQRQANRYIRTALVPGQASEAAEIQILIEKNCRKYESLQGELEKADPTEITIEDILRTISERTKIPVERLSMEEEERLKVLEDTLHKRIVGQDDAVKSLCRQIRIARTGIKDPQKPIGSFIFAGPTGVGKTEVCRAVAEVLFGDETAVIKLDMSELQQEHEVAKLIGAPPGYIGYGEGGRLTEAVKRRPYSVVLLDEIEKAHPKVFDLFLQVLDEGRLTDGEGTTVDLRNTIVVMTSNLGAQHKDKAGVRREVCEGPYFRKEFINRLTDVIVFDTLNREQISQVARLQLGRLAKRAKVEWSLSLEFRDEAVALVAEKGYDPQYGARPVQRFIERSISSALAEAVIGKKIKAGDHVVVGVKDGEITIEVGQKKKEETAAIAVRSDSMLFATVRSLIEKAKTIGREIEPTEFAAELGDMNKEADNVPEFTPQKTFKTVDNHPTRKDSAVQEAINEMRKDAGEAGFGKGIAESAARFLEIFSKKGKIANLDPILEKLTGLRYSGFVMKPDPEKFARAVDEARDKEIEISYAIENGQFILMINVPGSISASEIMNIRNHLKVASSSAEETRKMVRDSNGALKEADLIELKRLFAEVGGEIGFGKKDGKTYFWAKIIKAAEKVEAKKRETVPAAQPALKPAAPAKEKPKIAGDAAEIFGEDGVNEGFARKVYQDIEELNIYLLRNEADIPELSYRQDFELRQIYSNFMFQLDNFARSLNDGRLNMVFIREELESAISQMRTAFKGIIDHSARIAASYAKAEGGEKAVENAKERIRRASEVQEEFERYFAIIEGITGPQKEELETGASAVIEEITGKAPAPAKVEPAAAVKEAKAAETVKPAIAALKETLGTLKLRGDRKIQKNTFSLSWRAETLGKDLRPFFEDLRTLAAKQGILPSGIELSVKEDKGSCSVEMVERDPNDSSESLSFSFSDSRDGLTVKASTRSVSKSDGPVFGRVEEKVYETLDLAFSGSQASWFFDVFGTKIGGIGKPFVGLPPGRTPKVLSTPVPLQEIRLELSENTDPVFRLVVNPDAYEFLKGVVREDGKFVRLLSGAQVKKAEPAAAVKEAKADPEAKIREIGKTFKTERIAIVQPEPIKRIKFDGTTTGIALDKGILFVAEYGGRVRILDIKDPKDPKEISVIGREGSDINELSRIQGIAVKNDILVIVDGGNNRIKIYNIANPAEPKMISVFGSEGSGKDEFYFPRDVAIKDNILFVADEGNHRIKIYDISNPESPVFVSEITSNKDSPLHPYGIALKDNFLFAGNYHADYYWNISREVTIFDVTNPKEPKLINTLKDRYDAFDIEILENMLIMYSYREGEIAIYDVADVLSPELITVFDYACGSRHYVERTNNNKRHFDLIRVALSGNIIAVSGGHYNNNVNIYRIDEIERIKQPDPLNLNRMRVILGRGSEEERFKALEEYIGSGSAELNIMCNVIKNGKSFRLAVEAAKAIRNLKLHLSATSKFREFCKATIKELKKGAMSGDRLNLVSELENIVRDNR